MTEQSRVAYEVSSDAEWGLWRSAGGHVTGTGREQRPTVVAPCSASCIPPGRPGPGSADNRRSGITMSKAAVAR